MNFRIDLKVSENLLDVFFLYHLIQLLILYCDRPSSSLHGVRLASVWCLVLVKVWRWKLDQNIKSEKETSAVDAKKLLWHWGFFSFGKSIYPPLWPTIIPDLSSKKKKIYIHLLLGKCSKEIFWSINPQFNKSKALFNIIVVILDELLWATSFKRLSGIYWLLRCPFDDMVEVGGALQPHITGGVIAC